MASQCMLRLTLPYAQVAQAVLTNAHSQLSCSRPNTKTKKKVESDFTRSYLPQFTSVVS
jgi:hypothetical protein